MKKKTKNEKRRNQKKLYRKDDTKTEFKSRKIRLNESVQLRNNATKMLLNKNLKVNTKLKLNAFEKMNVNLESVNVDQITGETINGLAKYLLDEDNRIRGEFLKTVKSCFERLNERHQSLLPYIQILLIYIKCGLTHIDQRIVRDSKKLLDYLVQFMDDRSLDGHLIQVVNSRLKTNAGQPGQLSIIDLELVLLVLRIVQRNKHRAAAAAGVSNGRAGERNQFEWSPSSCSVPEEAVVALDRFEEFEFNFSFPAIAEEQEDEKEQFIGQIKESVEKEVVNK